MFDLVICEDYSFRCEVDEYYQVLLHMDVHNWNKKVAKDIKAMFKDAKSALRDEGFETAYTVTPCAKFVKLVTDDWTVGDNLTVDDKEYEVLIWDLV